MLLSNISNYSHKYTSMILLVTALTAVKRVLQAVNERLSPNSTGVRRAQAQGWAAMAVLYI
eukprot:1419057-Pleurochrysis_carterae.AAC.1